MYTAQELKAQLNAKLAEFSTDEEKIAHLEKVKARLATDFSTSEERAALKLVKTTLKALQPKPAALAAPKNNRLNYLTSADFTWHTDIHTGEVFITQNKLAELTGYDKGNLSKDLSKGVVKLSPKTAEVLTAGGLQGVVIYDKNDFVLLLMHQAKKGNAIAIANMAMIVGEAFTELGHKETDYADKKEEENPLKAAYSTQYRKLMDTAQANKAHTGTYVNANRLLNKAVGIEPKSRASMTPNQFINMALVCAEANRHVNAVGPLKAIKEASVTHLGHEPLFAYEEKALLLEATLQKQLGA